MNAKAERATSARDPSWRAATVAMVAAPSSAVGRWSPQRTAPRPLVRVCRKTTRRGIAIIAAAVLCRHLAPFGLALHPQTIRRIAVHRRPPIALFRRDIRELGQLRSRASPRVEAVPVVRVVIAPLRLLRLLQLMESLVG